MLDSGCYKVILQYPGNPRQILGAGMSSQKAYALVHEMASNLVENGGYTFTGWSASKTIARFERDGNIAFMAIIPVQDEVAS